MCASLLFVVSPCLAIYIGPRLGPVRLTSHQISIRLVPRKVLRVRWQWVQGAVRARFVGEVLHVRSPPGCVMGYELILPAVQDPETPQCTELW